MAKIDLGAWFVKVHLKNGEGFIYRINTGAIYCRGTPVVSPLDARHLEPIYESPEELIRSLTFMFTEGNFSCDCNLGDLLRESKQQPALDDPCGDTLSVKKLEFISPEGDLFWTVDV